MTVFYGGGVSFYIYTIDLETEEMRQLTGREDQRIDRPVASRPNWFADGRRLLFSVMAKGYKQDFDRGIYAVDAETGQTEGPLLELMQGACVGDSYRAAVGVKFVPQGSPAEEEALNGNLARYDFEADAWQWLTEYGLGSGGPYPILDCNPAGPEVAYSFREGSYQAGHVEQIYLLGGPSREDEREQLTRLGGENPNWSPEGDYLIFTRDVSRAPGGRYIPFRYDLQTGKERPFFQAQPDSLPPFPPLSSQILSRIPGRR